MSLSARRLVLLPLLLSMSVAVHAKPDKRLTAMTPAQFHAATLTRDDPLEFETTITTERGYRRGKAAKGTIDSDTYLRAVIDRQSGATRYEVWQEIRYFGPRRSYHAVHLEGGDGLARMPIAIARHGGDLCPNAETNGECVLTKTIAFSIDEPLLRDLAARYRSNGAQDWQFKLKDQGGLDVVGAIVPAEAAGLLLAVDAHRAKTGSPRASLPHGRPS